MNRIISLPIKGVAYTDARLFHTVAWNKKTATFTLMYIKRIEIRNIRSIEHFEMHFADGKEAGWHVLIGENGSGKSTIVRATALGLLDYADISAAGQVWDDWLNTRIGIDEIGSIDLGIAYDFETGTRILQNRISFDRQYYGEKMRADLLEIIFRGRQSFTRQTYTATTINQNYQTTTTTVQYPPPTPTPSPPTQAMGFSAAYGPFRRFTGGSPEKDRLYLSNPKLGAHLSVFGEDVALSEALAYLRDMYVKQLDKKSDGKTLAYIIKFVNHAQLLLNKTRIDKIDSDGVFFKDGNNNQIVAFQLSDGYRSVLSLTFELIRQLIRVFNADNVFRQIERGNMIIDLPGVVLIDEIDAHLHPDWQDSIGGWFTTYFPNIQFIVTTHSPLICRAAENGSIWRLATPGSGEKSKEVTGTARDRLIYGSISDAYGTQTFGKKAPISEAGNELLNELAELNIKSIMGQITPEEEVRMFDLQRILPTEQHPQKTTK
jgi:energy-coupling factor transporter ATP-binding protein EcfA2